MLQHPHECKRTLATVPLLAACLAGVHVVRGNKYNAGKSKLLDEAIARAGRAERPVPLFVLWPGEAYSPMDVRTVTLPRQTSTPPSAAEEDAASQDPAWTLVAIDGTWNQAAEMARSFLPALCPPGVVVHLGSGLSNDSTTLLRTEPVAGFVVTAEAVARAASYLEQAATGDGTKAEELCEAVLKPLRLLVSLQRQREAAAADISGKVAVGKGIKAVVVVGGEKKMPLLSVCRFPPSDARRTSCPEGHELSYSLERKRRSQLPKGCGKRHPLTFGFAPHPKHTYCAQCFRDLEGSGQYIFCETCDVQAGGLPPICESCWKYESGFCDGCSERLPLLDGFLIGSCAPCDFDLCESCASVLADWSPASPASLDASTRVMSSSTADGELCTVLLGHGTTVQAFKAVPGNAVLHKCAGFVVTPPEGDVLYLAAVDVEERRRWIEIIRQLCPPPPRKVISVKDIGESASVFLEMVQGFNDVKDKFDAAGTVNGLAEKVSELKSFGPKELRQNWNDLEELFREAASVKPAFDDMMKNLIVEAGIDPDKEYEFESEHGTKRMQAHSTAPLKGEERCREKVANEYGGEYDRLADVVRCSVICATPDELLSVMRLLAKQALRLKNRFATGCEMGTGYRDANCSVEIPVPGGGEGETHICEVQVHLAAILALKGEQHMYYEYFREFFKGGSDAYEKRMGLLRSLGGKDKEEAGVVKLSILERIVCIVNGDDVDALEGLARMCDESMMGNFKLLAHVSRALLAVEEGKDERDEISVLEGQDRVGDALQDCEISRIESDYFKEPEQFLRRAIKGRERILGKDHRSTLESLRHLASLLMERNDDGRDDVEEAVLLMRRALKARERTLGRCHVETLVAVDDLAGTLSRTLKGKAIAGSPEEEEVVLLYARSFEGCKRIFGPDHLQTLSASNNYATSLVRWGKTDEALSILRRNVRRANVRCGTS